MIFRRLFIVTRFLFLLAGLYIFLWLKDGGEEFLLQMMAVAHESHSLEVCHILKNRTRWDSCVTFDISRMIGTFENGTLSLPPSKVPYSVRVAILRSTDSDIRGCYEVAVYDTDEKSLYFRNTQFLEGCNVVRGSANVEFDTNLPEALVLGWLDSN